MTTASSHPVPDALLAAIKSDNITFLTACFSHGLPPDFRFPPLLSEPDLFHNNSPLLCVASYFNASTTVRYLLTLNINPLDTDDEGRSAVFYAAASGSIEILLLFTEHDLDITGCGQSAVRSGNLSAFQELIRRGLIRATDEDFHHSTFLHVAAFEGHIEIVRYLLTFSDPPLHARDRDGRTPLHLAAGNGHLAVCQVLVGAGADCEVRDIYDRSPVYYAAVQERYDIVELFLGGRLNELGAEGVTPLIRSVREGNTAMVQLLLEVAATDPNVRDREGFTALHCAIRGGKSGIVKLILNCERTDPNVQDNDGQTPMHWAVKKKDLELVQVLLRRKGTNIQLRNSAGKTALEELNGKLDRPPKTSE